MEFIYIDCQRMFLYRDVVLSTPPVLNGTPQHKSSSLAGSQSATVLTPSAPAGTVPIILWDLGKRLRNRCGGGSSEVPPHGRWV